MAGFYLIGFRDVAGMEGVTWIPAPEATRLPDAVDLRPASQPPDQWLPALIHPRTILEEFLAGLVADPSASGAVPPPEYEASLRGLLGAIESRLDGDEPGAPRALLDRAAGVLRAESDLRDLLILYRNVLHRA